MPSECRIISYGKVSASGKMASVEFRMFCGELVPNMHFGNG
jgi:hypothetical protein